MTFVSVLVAAIAGLATTQQPPAKAPQPTQDPSFPLPALYLPTAIRDYDVEQWSSWLNLASPQALLFRRSWESYQEAWKADIDRAAPELRQQQMRAGELALGDAHLEFADAVRAITLSERQSTESLLSHDSQLFDELEVILAESQKPAMSYVRAARDRHVGFATVPFFIAPAAIEIHVLVQQVGVTAETADVLTDCLHEYDAAIAPLLTKMRKTRWENNSRMLDIDADIAEGSKQHENARVQALIAERNEILKKSARLERRVASVNLEFGEKVLSLLPMPYSERFRDAFYERAYPMIFPDREDPSRLLIQLSNAAHLDNEHAAAFQTIYDGYRRRLAAIDRELCGLEDEAEDKFAATMSGTGRELIEVKSAQLLGKRREVHRKAMAEILAILPPDLLAENKRRIDSALAKVAENPH